jgi:DNA-binding transcriptional LysR family regulator
MMVPPLLLESDLIAMLPSRCLPPGARGQLVALPPPITVEGFPLHSAWHRRRDGDTAAQPVARLVEGLLTALEGWRVGDAPS